MSQVFHPLVRYTDSSIEGGTLPATFPVSATEPVPGDIAPEGTRGTGEAICPECRGTGRIDEEKCENCNGTGKVVQGVGGA
jgi:hypothetical protein